MAMFDLSVLNDEQKEAVVETEGYVRVIAGAGSGKTKALISRYIYLVEELGISTQNILCVTFTNKAANEMKKRVREIIGDKDTAFICTFHRFCVYILKEDIHTLNYPSNFLILDSEDTENILKTVYEKAKVKSTDCTFKKALCDISEKKHHTNYIQYILPMNSDNLETLYYNSEKIEDRIFYGYLYEQKKIFALDYDDLILFALYILENFKDKCKKWQNKMQYIMVDEFQDVNKSQYALANILSDYHKNLFIVGDPDQTIYSWRGARIEYMLNFDKVYPKVKTITMDKNYRSYQNILNASNSLIDKNEIRIKKDLTSMRDLGDIVTYNHLKTVQEEALWISDEIQKLVSAGCKYNDIAVLYRANFVSRSIEEAFIKHKIPYILYSGVGFYQRKEIKDALCYLRILVTEDNLAFLRIVNTPKRNIGKSRIEMLQEYSDKHDCSLYTALKSNLDNSLMKKSKGEEFVFLIEKYKTIYKEMSISELLTKILNDSGYEALLRQSGEQDRLDNLAELKQSIVEYENFVGEDISLESYLQSISLFTNMDVSDKKDSVKMMTMHSAKGLEFPNVFVCSLNEGICPSRHISKLYELEEERRLAYVAFTRAKNKLFLSDAEGFRYGNAFRFPSRFIFNVNKECLNYIHELDETLVERALHSIDENTQRLQDAKNFGTKFNVNDIVEHKVFGRGTIISIDDKNYIYVVQFDNHDTPRNLGMNVKLDKVVLNN